MNEVLRKLQYRGQAPVLLVAAPPEFEPLAADFDEPVLRRPEGGAGFILAFASSREEARRVTASLKDSMADETLFWLAYPKKTSKRFNADISRDTAWEDLGRLGLRPVRQVAIDADWSALRFKKAE